MPEVEGIMSRTTIKTSLVAMLLAAAMTANAGAQQFTPFIDPDHFQPDFQFFAPAELTEYGGEPVGKTGWFATYEISIPLEIAVDEIENVSNYKFEEFCTEIIDRYGSWYCKKSSPSDLRHEKLVRNIVFDRVSDCDEFPNGYFGTKQLKRQRGTHRPPLTPS